MRISRVEATVVAVPDPPLRNINGVHESFALRIVLQVHTDDGLVGLGEMPGGRRFLEEIEAASMKISGLHPWHWQQLRRLFPKQPRLWAAFEVPMLDLIGRATNSSVSDILGGAVRERVPFSAYLFEKFATPPDWLGPHAGVGPWTAVGMYNWTQEVLTPEALLAEAREFHRRYGFTTFKLKAGALPPDEEIEALRLIRKHFGDAVKLRIDPNAGWSRETALRLIPALEDIGLEYYEDPVEGMDAMADVQRHTHIPTATNMCLVRFDQFAEGVKKEAVRVVLADHHAWGGLWAFQQCGTTCATFGLGTSQHSNTHLGISMAAMVHAGAVAPNVTYASDTHYPWQQGWDVINETFYFEGGCLAVPTGPGLGVTIAPDRLAALAEIAAQRPSLARDDLTLMSHFVPGWQPRRGKW